MAAVSRRPHSNAVGRNGQGHANNDGEHELDDLHAALLQVFFAKRVLSLDDATNILSTLADVTGDTPFHLLI
jgi:hypothetical protein